jgi:hypothetical protein
MDDGRVNIQVSPVCDVVQHDWDDNRDDKLRVLRVRVEYSNMPYVDLRWSSNLPTRRVRRRALELTVERPPI